MAWHWHVMNASLWGPLARVCGPSAGTYTAFAACGPWVGWAFLAGLVGLLAATTWALSRSSDADRGWAIALTAMLLLAPIGWVYYVWWLVLPVCYARLPRWSAIAGTCLLLAPPWLVWLVAHESPILAATIGSPYAYGLLVWWVGLLLPLGTEHPLPHEEARAVPVECPAPNLVSARSIPPAPCTSL